MKEGSGDVPGGMEPRLLRGGSRGGYRGSRGQSDTTTGIQSGLAFATQTHQQSPMTTLTYTTL